MPAPRWFARRFVDSHLGDDDQQGITDDDRFPLEHFDAVVRHEAVDPEELTTASAADD